MQFVPKFYLIFDRPSNYTMRFEKSQLSADKAPRKGWQGLVGAFTRSSHQVATFEEGEERIGSVSQKNDFAGMAI